MGEAADGLRPQGRLDAEDPVLADAVPTIADAEEALGRPVSAAERARIIKTAVLATRPAKDTGVDEGDLRARWVAQAAALGWDTDQLTVVPPEL